MIDLFFDFCAPEASASLREDIKQALATKIDALAGIEPSLALRDYHAENLVWISDQTDLNRIGLLDFQDAVVTHPVYDLASLLMDARRDVSPSVEEQMITHFIRETQFDEDAIRIAYATIGLQRNLRILGVFQRLAEHHGKTGYLSLMPRVWGHVRKCLRHPELVDLQSFFDKDLR